MIIDTEQLTALRNELEYTDIDLERAYRDPRLEQLVTEDYVTKFLIKNVRKIQDKKRETHRFL